MAWAETVTAEDLAMEFLGFARDTPPADVGAGRRRTLGEKAAEDVLRQFERDIRLFALGLQADVERPF